jgi:CheY-like chemotaxis protein
MTASAPRILLVSSPEDGDWAQVLAAAGLEVSFAAGGEGAAEGLAAAEVSLCVVWAGDEQAVDACRRIRGGPRGAVVPLLVIGGTGTSIESRIEALEAGADSFLDREHASRQLTAKVLTLLGLDTNESPDPLEAALAAAEAVVPVAREADPATPAAAGVAVGAVSVLDVIEQVERRLAESGPGETVGPEPEDDGAVTAVEIPAPAESVRHGRDPLWDVLAGVLAERASGVLTLRREAVERKLFIEQGEIVMAVSSAREDRLVELLYREGRLTEEQYRLAVTTVGASGRRVGAVLVERGFIGSRELFPLVRHHYEALIYDSFAWGECDWSFQDGTRQPGERILLDVPTAALIVEGIRSRADREAVDALVPGGGRPVLQERGIAPLEEAGLLAEEQQVLELCDGSLSTGRLAGRSDMVEDDLRGLLAGLVVLGWLRVERVPAAGAEAAADPPPPSRANAEAGLRVERARVGEKLAVAEEGSYYAVLELPPEASGHEIRKAYRRLRAQFAPERFAVEELADLRTAAEVLRTVLEEAYEILRDPTLRESYRSARHGPEAGTSDGA